MAQDELHEPDEPAATPSGLRRWLTGWRRWITAGFLFVLAVLALAIVTLNTPIGQRFIVDRIAKMAPASGLRIEIGRIEGDIYGRSMLHDVVLSDPKGQFLQVPLVELDWRPLAWIMHGLDVRKLVAHRGTLYRLPDLDPADPDAPVLPDFDIRIDRFEVDRLTIAKGLVGSTSHRADMIAKVDIRSGRALIDAHGGLGTRDRFRLLLDAEPDGDRFDLALDYDAPRDGVIVGLVGVDGGYCARIDGDGSWNKWKGGLHVTRDGKTFAAFRLTNRAGTYGVLGQAYPLAALSGAPRRLIGSKLSLSASARLEDSVIDGSFVVRGEGLDANGKGAVDLAGNGFDALRINARLRHRDALFSGVALEHAVLTARLDGDFRDLEIDHRISVGQLVAGDLHIETIRHQAIATYDGAHLTVPLDARIGRVRSGIGWIDPQLVGGRLTGTVEQSGNRLNSDALALRFAAARADLSLLGRLDTGRFELAGPVSASGIRFDKVGKVGAKARIALTLGGGVPWSLRADISGTLGELSNATLVKLAGPQIRFATQLSAGGARLLTFRRLTADSDKLTLSLEGHSHGGTTSISGSGRHAGYGPFTIEASLAPSGPEAVLVLADPLPAAGLRDVRLALSPTDEGFRIETSGGSTLGPFAGVIGLVAPEHGPTRLAIETLSIWKTDITGTLTLEDGAAVGTLGLAGGGIDGAIRLTHRGGGQGFDANIKANGARFAGMTPLTVARARIDMAGAFANGSQTIGGDAVMEGITYGKLFVGRMAARASMIDGKGKVLASISGRRGSQFSLNFDADVAPGRIALAARGSFAGKRISMPRRAVLTRKESGGGWDLARSQVRFGEGSAVAFGRFGGEPGSDFTVKADRLPLSLIDIAYADVGLGGTASGTVEIQTGADGIPAGKVRMLIDDLTRSGLVLTSSPVDLALAIELSRSRMQLRAAVSEGGRRIGRVQAHIAALPASGTFYHRLQSGRLDSQLRYDGPAAALWRLAKIDIFDLTGPLRIAADASGTLASPQIRGSVRSDGLRVRSLLSGTDIRDVSLRGRFDGSTLSIVRMQGATPGGGKVSGSGTIDFTGVGDIAQDSGLVIGPRIDIKAAANRARLVNASGLSATITGPLRIVSSGVGGTIAGRLSIDRASWKLGTAADSQKIPRLRVREINAPANIAPARPAGVPWRYLIDARGSSRVDVDGMGLDSEWGVDLVIRGTTDDPRIGGEARVVRGAYNFAGTRFELTRGRIDFDENVPIDPQLDVRAQTRRDGLTVEVTVGGHATQPEVAFASVPALPEEEILSRLLFGNSITEISATDAVQLGAAVASLRGGGGMDPINRLRSAIGLDRLRIVAADPALDRETGVALGKNIGRRIYLELITDGRSYSATELEFRVTSWVSLLANVSTIGRESLVVEISKDY